MKIPKSETKEQAKKYRQKKKRTSRKSSERDERTKLDVEPEKALEALLRTRKRSE